MNDFMNSQSKNKLKVKITLELQKARNLIDLKYFQG